MPRANRVFVPGQVWHITQRCLDQAFLLRFAKDRNLWCRWLYEARSRYGLCVLNYIVTSNHIHLLVHDQGRGEISASMQLVSGRVAQAFNVRKQRSGPLWEDRYHATAVETDSHLARCMTYIDLNMVRANAVAHPQEWPQSGYREMQDSRQRYCITDTSKLMTLLGCTELAELRALRNAAIDEQLTHGLRPHNPMWSQAIAVGSEVFVSTIAQALQLNPRYRTVLPQHDSFVLREALRPLYSAFSG